VEATVLHYPVRLIKAIDCAVELTDVTAPAQEAPAPRPSTEVRPEAA
jgi:hypothetical protein